MKMSKMLFGFKYVKFILGSILVAIISLIVYCKTCNLDMTVIPNVCGNIFAGLLTSIIIAIYSNLRNEELEKITNLVRNINDINTEIHKYFETYNTEKANITRKIVVDAYEEYCNLQIELDKLRTEYDDLKLKGSPKPGLGDEDKCVEEMEETIRLGLSKKKHNCYEDYLDFMVNSSTVMLRQNNIVINYLLMHLDACSKFML